MATPAYNYPEMLNFYYDNNLHEELGKNAHLLFTGLLHKANKTFWKEKISITNGELSHLTMLEQRSLKRAIETLSKFKIDGKKLVKVSKTNHKQISVFAIDYTLLSAKRLPTGIQNAADEEEVPEEEAGIGTKAAKCDPNGIHSAPLHNITKQTKKESLSETPAVVTTSSKELATLSEKERRFWETVELMKKACPTWYPSNDFINDRLENMLADYPDHQIQAVITRAGTNGVKNTAFLGYVEGGLQNFEKYYGGEASIKKSTEDDKKLKEAREWMGMAIRGHRHDDIAYGLHELSQLTGETIESHYDAYVPRDDDNYKSLAEYQQLYEEAQNE